jgi:tRNA G18 (ribose-2'-O)-methylase SpoU
MKIAGYPPQSAHARSFPSPEGHLHPIELVAARLIPIDSIAHPALELYTAIRERDLAKRENVFVAEGAVVVRVLVRLGRFTTRSLLLETRRVEALHDVLALLPESVPAYVVPQAIMDGVVGFSVHRGVLAIGERGDHIDPSILLAGASLVVGLVGLSNHDNVGSVFRNAAAFGVDAVLLDAETCDPLYRKAIRVSAGAALVVPFARFPSASAMLDGLHKMRIEPIALTPRGEETTDDLWSPTRAPFEPSALLLGTEGQGLPDAVLARSRRVRIAMAEQSDSLNVAVASGIALYEVRRHASRARRDP